MASSPRLADNFAAQLDAVLRRMDKLEAQNQRLRAEVATLRRPAAVGALVEALALTFRDKSFVGSDVLELAAARPTLNAAAVAAIGEDWNPRKLGKLLAEIRGESVAGYMVVQQSVKDRAGAVWRVQVL